MPERRFKVGDLVQTYFDTGAMGVTVLYGKIISAGDKRAGVLWESGWTNRIKQTRTDVVPARDKEGAAKAMESVTRIS